MKLILALSVAPIVLGVVALSQGLTVEKVLLMAISSFLFGIVLSWYVRERKV